MGKGVSKSDIDSLWALILRTNDAMSNARTQELSHYNINRSQGQLISHVYELGDNATLKNIARRSFRKINTASEILTRMEREGLVKRVKTSGKDRRLKFILTEKGTKAYHQASKRESIFKIMSCLTREEHLQLKSCCEKLCKKAFEELGIQPVEISSHLSA